MPHVIALLRHPLLACLILIGTASFAKAQTPPPDGENPTGMGLHGGETYVLVHGAFGGGWVWQEVAARLRAAGHRVYTPTLAGVGARSHLATPEIDLSTHIEDVVALLEFERLDDVILVGHSYGGFVIAGVADHLPERLAHMVYLDALVPQPGEAVAALYDPAVVDAVQKQAEDGWRVPPTPPVTDPRFRPQPLGTLLEPLELTNTVQVPHIYIDFTVEEEGISRGALRLSSERARERGWNYEEIETTHMGMWTEPEALTAMLLMIEE